MIALGAALDTAIALFRRFKSLFLIVPLGIALAVQTARIEGFLWFDGLKDKLAKAEATIAQMELASEQARKDQIAANLATEARYRAKAEKTDVEYRETLQGALRAADRYAAANRVPAHCARSPGTALAPAEGDDPPRDNGPGETAELVAITREDFDALTENTIRLQAAHDWATGLVEEGLAVKTAADLPEPAF